MSNKTSNHNKEFNFDYKQPITAITSRCENKLQSTQVWLSRWVEHFLRWLQSLKKIHCIN